MVGSRDSIASANIVLNTIVAEAFAEACEVLEKADDFQLAVHDLIKEYAMEKYRESFSMETVTLKLGEGSRKTRTSEHQIYGGSNSGNGDRESSDIV